MENFYCYLAFFLSVVFLVIKLLHSHNQKLPPTPFALPIIGHAHLLKQPLYRTLETLSSQYGPILYLKFGSRSILVLSSPSLVEECFTQNDVIFANRPRTMAGDHFTYNLTAPVWAPYGHLWRNLRRILAVEIFSQINLQKSSIVRQEEVHSLLRLIFRVSNRGPQRLELRYLFSLLMFNIMMRMVAGKPCVGEEAAASMDVGKQHLKEFRETYAAGLSMNICDFFPILRWVGYKGLEKSMIRLQRKRDKFLGVLIEEIKQKKASSSLKTTTITDVEKKRTLIETLLSLRESEPELCSDDVIKSIVLVSDHINLSHYCLIVGLITFCTSSMWFLHHFLLTKVTIYPALL
jgi:hypothetical protein